jgi:hypothetical protein
MAETGSRGLKWALSGGSLKLAPLTMARPLPESQLKAIIHAVRGHPEGATFLQIGAALGGPPPLRNLQRWVSALVEQRRLVRIGATNSIRYRWVDPATAGPASAIGFALPAATPVTQALQTLVGQPIVTRPPAHYHRDWLDCYVPNTTFYLPADVRTLSGVERSLSADGRPIDAGLSRVVADLAWRSGWLEGGTLTLPAVESLVAGQPVDCDAREAQLVRRQQAAWIFLVANAPQLMLTRDVLLKLHAMIAGLDAFAPVELRRQPLVFSTSTYRPPADPIIIDTCLTQILTLSAAITDPIEQAFFSFVHLLALQPLPSFNASVACLGLNLPLLRTGLSPITFATVAGRDLLDAVLAVWELNRPELLAEVFARAWMECQQRYLEAPMT